MRSSGVVMKVLVAMVWCSVSAGCMSGEVKKLSATSETKGKHYQLIYSENDGLCGYVGTTLNDRLKKNGTVKIDMGAGNWHEAVNRSTFGFPEWKLTAPSTVYKMEYPFANFDINNDGKDETIILDENSYGSGWTYMIPFIAPYGAVSETKPFADEDKTGFKFNDNVAPIDLSGYGYELKKLKEKPEKRSADWVCENFCMIGLQDIQFFRYQNRTYFTLTENDHTAGINSHNGIDRIRRQFLVVGEYLGGKLNQSKWNQDDVIKSSCYFELILK